VLKSGAQYLESIRDGRVIYVADERVEDVTRHPAFRNGARTYAALYELKSQPELADTMSYEEGGERYSMYFLRPRTREDLVRRTRAHEVIADFGCGVLGRSPDAGAGSVTGMTMKPEILDQKGGHKDHLLGSSCAGRTSSWSTRSCRRRAGATRSSTRAPAGRCPPCA
jgi:4-hydroxyphenylacetate 3-monooxygenase